MMDIWLNATANTLLLCMLVSIVACLIGSFTAICSWLSNQYYTFFIPLLLLSVPPWLFAFYLGDSFLIIDPWLGSIISLGVTSSVYPHSFIASALNNRGHKDYELGTVIFGDNVKRLVYALYPSFRISLLPSVAVVSAEVVADFGVVNYFGIQTLTMLTYNVWTSTWQFELLIPGLILLIIVSFLLTKSNIQPDNQLSVTSDQTDKNSNRFSVLAIFPTILLLAYIIIQSLYWIFNDSALYAFKVEDLLHSAILVCTVSVISVLSILIYMCFPFLKTSMKKAGIFFYALPGTAIAAAYMYLGASFIPLIFLLVIAIATRYFGLIIHSTAAADDCNSKNYEVLNVYINKTLDKAKAKARMLLPSICIGLCLIILDVLRELPISLILNPMDFSTLAMRMNYIATTEYTPGLAAYSLTLIGIGLILCIFVIGAINARNKKPAIRNS